MLQIRLSKGPSSDGGGGPARSAPPLETVTVACPEHLVIADLPVAKSVGVLTTAFASSGRNMGRRSRRQLGDRIHLCVRCDFPIAIYGRLIPCEHAFCLACARSDPSCYLCDERVQKIQTIKMLEGIFICAAPHCLKSFLKKAEFESHVHDTHADLLQLNAEKEGGSETNNLNVARPTSADVQKQSSLPEVSTARAPPRSGFSPSSNSMPPDREDRVYRLPSRDQSYPRPPPQVRPPPFPSSQSHQPSDIQSESNIPQFSDRPYNWFPPPQRIDNQGSTQYQQDTDQFPLERSAGAPPESMFPSFPAQLPHQPNYPIPGNPHQPLITASFNFPSFPADGSQPFFGAPVEMPRAESTPSEGGSEQGSVLGIPPAPTGVAGFRENYARPWGMDLMSMPFPPMPIVQAISDSFVNPADSQGGMAFFQGDFGQGLLNPAGKESEQQSGSGNHIDSKSLLSTLPGQMHSPLPLPPPPPHPPPLSLQLNRTRFSASGDSTRDGQGKGRFGNWPD
ncbi:hypothetical protein IEQ34_022663 [Dendrobium chrysotoxum]|uniref:RING-type E3 ubiquitin transferase n=2 Tax=Dendrobium TaxID=37818 RepID=A0AAV7FZM6_DENCH|nr:hypothetical protein IEQ34_022663 [Dendrobium chrysotoxum]